MKTCPRCGETLVATQMGSVEVEGCSGCGGVWFDDKELTAVAQSQTLQLSTLEDRFQASQSATEHAGAMRCPGCKQALVEFEFRHSPGIKLDGCPQCKGIWVDDGELQAIHTRLTGRSEAPRPAAAQPAASPAPAPDIRQKARLAVGFLTRLECPNCKQSNPAASPVCWACGTFLQGKRGMLCPRCDRPLTGKAGLGVRLDTCSACGGMWLDAGEMATLLRHDAAQLTALQQQIGEVDGLSHMRIEGHDILICPLCAVGMYARPYAADSGISINACTQCKGTWLDAGELTLIAERSSRRV